MLSPERQSARMSKITNDGLTRSVFWWNTLRRGVITFRRDRRRGGLPTVAERRAKAADSRSAGRHVEVDARRLDTVSVPGRRYNRQSAVRTGWPTDRRRLPRPATASSRQRRRVVDAEYDSCRGRSRTESTRSDRRRCRWVVPAGSPSRSWSVDEGMSPADRSGGTADGHR